MVDVTDHCAECGFTYDIHRALAAADAVRTCVAEVSAILRNKDIDVRSRPRPDVWSPVEYGCHLRDVLLVQRERVLTARRDNGFVCTTMGRDIRVEHEGYAEQDPIDVARQLVDAASLFGNVLD